MVEDVFLAAFTLLTTVWIFFTAELAEETAVFTFDATAATAPATAPTTPATVVFLVVLVDVFLVLVFLLLDELLELLDEEDEEEELLLDPSYFAHCFIVSFTLQLIHVPLGAIVVSLTDASVSMS